MSRAAHVALASLIGDTEIIECDRYTLDGGEILVATLVDDPDSDGDGYYSSDIAVAWDPALGRAGELTACYVPVRELATWLSLRWPATTGSPGFLRDGTWSKVPIRFGMGWGSRS